MSRQAGFVLKVSFVFVVYASGIAATGCATGKNAEDKTKDAQWHYEMASGYFESNKVTKAIGALTRALELDEDHARAHHLLGFIYMGRNEYRKAAKHLETATELQPNFFPAKNNLGSVYMAQKNWKQAAKIFESLVDEPQYTTPHLAHNNLGWVYFKMGKIDEAIKNLKKATYLKPEMCLAYNNLGKVYRSEGEVRDARQSFEKAIEKCPEKYAEPHYRLGKLLIKSQRTEALSHFKKCVDIAPESQLAKRCRVYIGQN